MKRAPLELMRVDRLRVTVRRVVWALMSSFLLVSVNALALQVGEPQILSALGEPLKVVIPVDANGVDPKRVQVRLASAEQLEKLGITDSGAHAPNFRAIWTTDHAGLLSVEVTSSTRVFEPILGLGLSFLDGRSQWIEPLILLIDPPGHTPAAILNQAPSAADSSIKKRAIPPKPAPSSSPSTQAKLSESLSSLAPGDAHKMYLFRLDPQLRSFDRLHVAAGDAHTVAQLDPQQPAEEVWVNEDQVAMEPEVNTATQSAPETTIREPIFAAPMRVPEPLFARPRSPASPEPVDSEAFSRGDNLLMLELAVLALFLFYGVQRLLAYRVQINVDTPPPMLLAATSSPIKSSERGAPPDLDDFLESEPDGLSLRDSPAENPSRSPEYHPLLEQIRKLRSEMLGEDSSTRKLAVAQTYLEEGNLEEARQIITQLSTDVPDLGKAANE